MAQVSLLEVRKYSGTNINIKHFKMYKWKKTMLLSCFILFIYLREFYLMTVSRFTLYVGNVEI